MTITPGQSRAARGLLNWSQSQLAATAKISRATLAEFEAGNREPYERTLLDIRTAFESAGIEFTNGNAPGVKLHKPGARVASIPLEDLNAENDE